MKILHITGEYPPYVLGGLGIYVDEITKVLAQKHAVKICVLRGESTAYNIIKGSQNKNLDIVQKNFRQDQFIKLTKTINQPETIISEFGLEDFLLDPPDIIHVHDWYGTVWAAAIKSLRSIPFVMTSHLPTRAGFTYSGHPISMKLKMQLEALGVRMADRIIVPSHFVSNTLIGEYNADQEAITVIPNGVDYSFYAKKKPQNKNGISRINLLSVSRLTEQKGIMYLLDVVKIVRQSIPNIQCTIVGDGPLRDQLLQECRRLDLQETVRFVGFLQKEQLHKLYQSSTIFLSTSIYEPFGMVILEAMAAGLPVVSFDVGGIREIINHRRDGILVFPCDIKGMAQSIIECIGNSKLLRKLSFEGSVKARTYSWEIIVNKLESVYKSVQIKS